MFDPQLYRTKEEVERWMQHDPIPRFRDWALGAGEIHAAHVEEIEAEVAREIERAVAFAEAGSWEPASDLMKDVGAERRT
jgi:TPP-dependent pyruvate/acetoin dehydrogenase alpha subunit